MNGQGSGWNFGDVNYDGLIDTTDLGRTLAALRSQGAPLGSTANPGSGAPIPEPTSLALLTATVPLLSRRKRRSPPSLYLTSSLLPGNSHATALFGRYTTGGHANPVPQHKPNLNTYPA